MPACRSGHSDLHTADIHSGSVFRALATQEIFLSSSHSAPVSYKRLRALSDARSPRAGRTCAGSKLKSALTQTGLPDHICSCQASGFSIVKASMDPQSNNWNKGKRDFYIIKCSCLKSAPLQLSLLPSACFDTKC